MIIYGLDTCAVCRRARRELEADGHEIIFRDVRSDPLSDAELATLVAEFGDRLVDRSTPDYRALNDWLKNSDAEAQISARPKVMTRPVIENDGVYHLGWDAAVQDALLRRLDPSIIGG